MNLKQIKEGDWYETKQGIGKAIRVGGTHPPSVRVKIVLPFPRGEVMLAPRDVIARCTPPADVIP